MSKQTGSGNTGWLPVALRHQGLLANRPDFSSLGNGGRGYEYWATDVGTHGALLKWRGSGWIDIERVMHFEGSARHERA